jgi:hypothetical protein
MMRRPSRAIILAEDEAHDMFIRRYLLRLNLGLREREMYTEAFPDGRGCGEQWVRTQYARAVKEFRWRSTKSQTVLVVVIDADTGEVSRRLRQLEDGLKQASMERRHTSECIAHFVPRRNIETWILCLNGHSVNEEKDYSDRRDIEVLTAPAAGLGPPKRHSSKPLYSLTLRRNSRSAEAGGVTCCGNELCESVVRSNGKGQ